MLILKKKTVEFSYIAIDGSEWKTKEEAVRMSKDVYCEEVTEVLSKLIYSELFENEKVNSNRDVADVLASKGCLKRISDVVYKEEQKLISKFKKKYPNYFKS